MKTLARWYKWILLAVMFQFCVLFYINNIFLNSDGSVSITTAEGEVKEKPVTGVFTVAAGVKEVKVSYNSRFGAYVDTDGALHIVDIKAKKDKKIAGLEDDMITFFKWLPDRDMIIYSSDTKNGKKGVIQISTYEADYGTIRDLPEIKAVNAQSKVMDIDLSPYTNVVYAQLNTSETRSRIYRINVMNQYSNVLTLGADAIIKESAYVNKLVYQNPGEPVYVYNDMDKSKSKITIDSENVRILDIDANDTLFIAALGDDGKVTQLYQQKITESRFTDDWTKTPLKEPVPPEDIVVSGSGNVYYINRSENKIINVKNDLKASFRGEFLEVLNGTLVSIDGNKVNINSLKEY
ncbi:hypothetical protein [Ruminiclostridium cellobioparum]|uniref:hypothetical protein n=1 Tax=Ruminiclostridium cellobioparum TaxID=29355 RepID=UPI0028AC3521|nr:hypothetical protein [Ruminiclostridium cellobioparum]